MTATIESRFWPKVIKAAPEACWLWAAYIDPKGYGRLRVGDRMQPAPRISYELHYGAIPKGRIVCHRCDTPACVNPGHLFAGSYKDNSDDMRSKGREKKARGERNGFSRLSDLEVMAIRASTKSLRALAAEFGVTYGHVGKIRRGELWV